MVLEQIRQTVQLHEAYRQETDEEVKQQLRDARWNIVDMNRNPNVSFFYKGKVYRSVVELMRVFEDTRRYNLTGVLLDMQSMSETKKEYYVNVEFAGAYDHTALYLKDIHSPFSISGVE